MGKCDRLTGECACRDGFTGSACQRMACKNATSPDGEFVECGGRGRCLSMREMASQADFVSLFNSGAVYDEWDADQIYGCVCDEDYTGYACDQRSCPYGVDPLFPGDDEIQVIDCTCNEPCSGTLKLAFNGFATSAIPPTATAELVKARLEALSTIGEVELNMTGNFSICDNLGTTTEIIFRTEHGQLPAIQVISSSLDSPGVTIEVFTDGERSSLYPDIQSRRGTKVYAECSNHGICDYDTGSCLCHDYFSSSDQKGGEGNIPDCGYVERSSFFSRDTTNGSCPIVYGAWFSADSVALECAGVGNCTGFNNTCECNPGYFGPGCERMECPRGHAWYGEPAVNISHLDLNSTAHAAGLLCSGMGDCDFETGECTCEETHYLFDGDGCELLACYSNDTETDCSGAGDCMTLNKMAHYGLDSYGDPAGFVYQTPWDADMIQGCHCYRSPSVDNQDIAPGGEALTYRGPFAFADTDYFGYGCEYMRCPVGDNPMTQGQVNEIQRIRCRADFGVFRLTFRNRTTDEIEPYATLEVFEAALEDLLSIRDVQITFNNNTEFICNSTDWESTIDIEFLTEHGDLPMMTADTTYLYDNTTHAPVFEIIEVQRGTKENVECSSRGICGEDTGVCICLPGYNSSDGRDAPGERGDCGYRNPWATQMWFEEAMEQLTGQGPEDG